MGKSRPRAMLLVALAPCAACSLFVDLSDLNEGESGSGDSGIDAPAEAGGADVNAIDAGGGDSGSVFATDAAWAFVGTNGVESATVSLSNVLAGDLLIIGCDMPSTASTLTFTGFTADIFAPQLLGPNAPNSLETYVAWGIVGSTPDGGTFTMTAQPSGTVTFIDCTIDNYRGGTKTPSLVDSKSSGATGAGLVNCGPVKSAKGGVGYYIAVRYTCAGLPTSPFTQRQDLEGNPNGDAVPTDGTMLQTELADCNSSTGDWVCTTIAISP